MLRVALCGGVAVEVDGRRLPDALLAGRQGRLVLAYLVCERHRSVPRDELAELVWGDRLPSSWAASLSAVVSKLRRVLGAAGLDGAAALPSAFGSYRLHLPADAVVDWDVVVGAVERAERADRDGDVAAALDAAGEAQDIARRGFLSDESSWVDEQRERLRDLNVRAAHAAIRAHLRAGAPGRAVEAAREALDIDELREETYRLLMQALAATGERGEALRVWERCRVLLAEELGTDPAPETEAAYRAVLGDAPTPPGAPLPSGVVTFLLTDIVDSTALWDRDSAGMATALERHDRLVAEIVQGHGGVLLKAKLEGDATVSVFPRASAGARAALAIHQAMASEPWPEGAEPTLRMALHTGEAIERDGDYFGPALNRAARLRSLAGAGQILVSQAVAEVVRDHIPGDVALRSLGEHQLRGLSRGEHVFELAPDTATHEPVGDLSPHVAAFERPPIHPVLSSGEPFVGREVELEALATDWATAIAGTARGMFVAGEPGVGKTRLAAEWARRAHEQGALVLYGRCDEELGAPYQPFAEALRALLPRLGAERLGSVRGVEELSRLVPDLADLVPGVAGPSQADPDTERYLLFDALSRLVASVSADLPLLIVIDDMHWAAKPTLLLLRHLLRNGDGTRLQIVGTYRSTDLDRTHPLSGVLADLHLDGTAERLPVTGLDADEVGTYLRAAGHDDDQLGAALSTVTSGNPFFLIEVLRHVEESGGRWDPSTLPQGVREAVGRRLSRLSEQANEALLVAAVVGSRFSIELVERVLERDLLDAVEEARRAGLVVDEPGDRFRFNHALVRQSLLAEVASVKRTRLHQRIAAALEATSSPTAEAHLAELAHHYMECAFAGGAAKAVDYSRRAGEQAMARLAYEEAAELYDRALEAADIDGSGATDEDRAELLLARCEALLAAGEPTAAATSVERLERVAQGSPRLAAWATCFAGQLAALTHPERLDATADDVAAAARQLADLDDAEGEAKAHTVRASCLARLGRIADCEAALDQALTAGRRAGDPRRVNAVLAGAPIAALWGPSPVARASGRCLDVVRVLRITTGSPAVEAIALRCQGVLESLRGRADAARRMLGAARRSLEDLGHTHGLLETDLSAGIIELVSGEPAAAEIVLRRAYDGFVARGVGVDAAQAAALLARAVLAQGRVDEAIALTRDSERLAGVDLKAAIAWRAARAEALVHQALIDQADAQLALAVVLRAAGDEGEAGRAAAAALDLYSRKGATARVETARALVGAGPATAPSPGPSATRRRVRPNLATAMWDRVDRFEGSVEPLASLGQRHGLVRRRGEMDSSGAGSLLFDVVRVDERGEIVHREVFDDVQAAVARLVELHAEDEVPPEQRAGRSRIAGYLRDDTPFAWTEDAVLTDHRRAGLGTVRGSDAIREAGRALRAVAGDVRRRMVDILGSTEHVLLFDVVNEGRTESGDSFEMALLALGEFDVDGRQRIVEWFEPDQVDEALARFDELTGTTAPSPPRRRLVRPNHATRCLGGGGRMDEERIRGWSSELRDDMEFVDQRMRMIGTRDEMVRTWIAMTTGGGSTLESTPLASLGERHALVRYEWRSGSSDATSAGLGPAEIDWFNVIRTDDEGRASWMEQIDGSDLANAVGRLVELHAEDELDADALETRLRVAAAFRTTNTMWEDDAVVVDHRPTSLGTLSGRSAIAGAAGALRELAGGVQRTMVDVLGLTEGLSLFELVTEGNVEDGGPFEISVIGLTAIGVDGLASRQEWFAPEQAEHALARFEELAGASSSTPAANAAADVLRAVNDAMVRGDTNAISALMHESVVMDDRRSLVGGFRMEGRDECLRYARSAYKAGARSARDEIMATRGARAVLCHGLLTGRDAELENLALAQIDADGRLLAITFFDADQQEAALRELEALDLPDGHGPANAATGAWAALIAAFRARDWDAFAARLSSTATAEDRRPLLGGIRHEGRDDFIVLWKSFVDIGVLDLRWTSLAVRGDRLVLMRAMFVGDDAEGEVLFVHEFDDDGRYLSGVSFDPADLDGARAEFEARAVAQTAGSSDVRDTSATRGWARTVDLVKARDWASLTATMADDARAQDRRHLVGGGDWIEGKDGFVGAWQSVAAIGVTGIHEEPIATRGDSLALLDVLFEGAGSEVEVLLVVDYAPDGIYRGGTWYDVVDLELAVADLDARYVAQLPDPLDATWRTTMALADRYNARDVDGLRDLVREDAVIVDERVTGWGHLERESFLDHLQELVREAPDARLSCVADHAVTAGGAVASFHVTGTVPGGGDFELPFCGVCSVRDARIVRLDLLGPSAVDEGIRRLG